MSSKTKSLVKQKPRKRAIVEAIHAMQQDGEAMRQQYTALAMAHEALRERFLGVEGFLRRNWNWLEDEGVPAKRKSRQRKGSPR